MQKKKKTEHKNCCNINTDKTKNNIQCYPTTVLKVFEWN